MIGLIFCFFLICGIFGITRDRDALLRNIAGSRGDRLWRGIPREGAVLKKLSRAGAECHGIENQTGFRTLVQRKRTN